MTAIQPNDILFDDLSILKQFIGQKELTALPPNTNCDCIGYSATEDYEELDTDQIAPAAGQAH